MFGLTCTRAQYRSSHYKGARFSVREANFLIFKPWPHSSVLAWRIPGTGEPGGLPSMGSHRVGHD